MTQALRRDHAELVREVAMSPAAGRSAFAASWRRSLLHHRIDPATGAAPDRLGAQELRARTEASGRLMAVARPILDRLARAAADAGCSVLLSDPEGLVLDERLRPADVAEFHGWGLAPGALWSEAAEGTNGIGTCVAEKRPVIVWRNQHFRARNTRLACMGAPVFGPEGELAGVIDVSSVREDLTEAYARLIALTTQDAAQRIEAELFRARWAGARILAPEAEGTEAGGPVLLAIDADDLVVGASRAARRSFDLSPERLGRVPAGDLLGFGAPQGLHGAERAEMTRALARAGGNVSAAARELGIGRATFYRKMKALGIEG
ncbi:GAF domain-containing protein [Frigidibacter sp. MR17.14]|uniref:GAF domain-containing protein n=1 Tax=Frigidibacter sp. MR17.14 TaxID=3126509 RepID=UPI003012CFCC